MPSFIGIAATIIKSMNASFLRKGSRSALVLAVLSSLATCTSLLNAALPLQPEQIVVTCFSGTINYYSAPPTATPNLNPNGYVMAQFDTQTGTIGPLIPPTTSPPKLWTGSDVPPFSGFHNETGQRWNAQRLGEVFGIAVDDAAAPNIYVTATECYNIVGSGTPLPKGPGGPGGVYRLDGTSGAMSFGSLPNNSVNGPGLGNVCFRRAGNGTGYLYVSDLEDGMIYRMDAASLTAAGSPFDHGVQGRPNESLSPIADDGTPGLTQFGRRIWGVQTFQNRLYYAVWWEDSRNVNLAESNEIWSVDLDNNGDFIPSTARRRITLPNLTVYPWSHPIASIDFSPAGTMFLAERYWQYLGISASPTFGAHHTRIFRYTLSGPNWVTTPNTTYHIGGDASFFFGAGNTQLGANSAGGVAVNCDESIWATGDMYAGSYSSPPNVPFGNGDLGYVYGCLRIPTGGNSMYAGPGYGSFAIDYDGNTNSISKFGVGAIATVRNCCLPPPSGMVAWWPLDELTGATTYADLSGSGNNAFVESGPVGSFQSPFATPGKVAGAGTFISSPTRGRAPNAASLNFGTGSFSLDCWIRPVQGVPNSWQTIVDKLDLGALLGYTIGISNGNLTLRAGDGALYTHTGPAVNSGLWNFVGVMVNRSANTVQFYVNGVPSAPQTLVPTGTFNNTLDLLIGAPYAPNIFSEASLDEIELFNRVLTTNDLGAIFAADSRGKCKSGQPPCTNSVVSIVCPTNLTIACAPVVFYPPPQAATTCGTITNITCTPPSGSLFPVGPTIVICTAYDSYGHSNSCTFTITVTPDTTPPVIDCTCIENTFHEALNVNGCQGTVPSLCNYSHCYSDNCCLASCSQTPPAGTVVGPGVTLINFTITDCAGNSNSCVVQMTVTPPPQGCNPCTNKFNFLNVTTTATNGTFTGANGVITATTTGGPFLSLNNTPYPSKFTNLFAASGTVTGYLAQIQFGAPATVTFDLSGYAITPGTVFGIWNITEESGTYSVAVYNCTNGLISPPFPASTFTFMGWDDDALSGNIGWYHMTLNPATGKLTTAPFKASGTDCDAAFWTNLPPTACKLVVTRTSGDADGVDFYFAQPDPCCRITCPTNITVSTCSSNAVVNYPAPTVSGQCGPGVSVICNPPSGSTFPLGTTTVTCSIIDALGTVSDSCSFTVTVLPQQPQWSVICPNPASSINVTGCPPKMPNVAGLISIATNCAQSCAFTITQDIPPGTVLTPGNHVTIVTICDCLGNCTFCDVTVNAFAAGGNPTIQCPPNQVVITCNTSAVVRYKVKAAGYNGVITCTPPSGSVFPLGVTVVTCTATNACGGIATCSFTVTVRPPPNRWQCAWQVGIGIPFENVGGATYAVLPVDIGSPAVCIFPNPGNPTTSGALLHFGQAQVATFTAVLDFTAPDGARMDFVLPPSTLNSNNIPLLSFIRKSGPKGYCVKTSKIFEDDPSGVYRTITVNTNGQLLDSFTYTPSENLTNEPFMIGFQPGVTNCHVTVELNCADGSLSIEFAGPVTYNAARKGWDGCIYGPDRPVKKPTSKVYFTPPPSPGVPPISDLYLYAIGVAEAGLEEPTLTAGGRKWGDGHVTLMKAYDDGGSMEFTRTTETGDDDGIVHLDLGHAESFDLSLTKFATNALPGETLLTRTTGSIASTTPPPYLDALLLQENSGQVDCSADFSNLGSPTVHVLIYKSNALMAERTGVTGQLGQPLLTLPTWPTGLGKLGGTTPCRRIRIPLGLITLPGSGGTIPPQAVLGDEVRILAELPTTAPLPDYYGGFDFLASPDGDWGVTNLQRATICVPAPVAIGKSSGGVSVSWTGTTFRLQGAEQATGPWFDLGVASPVEVPATSTARFFRLVCD